MPPRQPRAMVSGPAWACRDLTAVSARTPLRGPWLCPTLILLTVAAAELSPYRQIAVGFRRLQSERERARRRRFFRLGARRRGRCCRRGYLRHRHAVAVIHFAKAATVVAFVGGETSTRTPLMSRGRFWTGFGPVRGRKLEGTDQTFGPKPSQQILPLPIKRVGVLVSPMIHVKHRHTHRFHNRSNAVENQPQTGPIPAQYWSNTGPCSSKGWRVNGVLVSPLSDIVRGQSQW